MRFLDSICWLSDQDGLWVGRGHPPSTQRCLGPRLHQPGIRDDTKAQSQTTGEAHGGGRTASGPEQRSPTREVGRVLAEGTM